MQTQALLLGTRPRRRHRARRRQQTAITTASPMPLTSARQWQGRGRTTAAPLHQIGRLSTLSDMRMAARTCISRQRR